MDVPDYYELLEVPRDADADQIKRSYRKLAMKYHPDSYRGDDRADAEERFKRLSEAYEVLSDPEKRGRYDQLRSGGRPAAPTPAGGGTRHMSPEEFEQIFGGRGFSDFFAEQFGEDMAAAVGRTPHRHGRFRYRGSDVRASIAVPLALAVSGGRRSFDVEATTVCPTCGGSGLVQGEHICPACGGLGRRRGRRRVDVRIPKRLRNGQMLRLKDLGEPGVDGGEHGDMYLTVEIVADGVYSPDGDDVHAEVPLAPWEAALGAKVPVRTLEREVTLTIPPNTTAGAKLRLPGEGLPRADGSRGDFLVHVSIALPPRLDDEQRELLRRLRDSGGAAVSGGARSNGSVS